MRMPFALFRADDPTNRVVGATATIAVGGTVSFAEALRDGRHFTSAAALGKNGEVPFYFVPSAGEALIGWLNFTPPPVTVTGEISWVRNGTNGFSYLLRP